MSKHIPTPYQVNESCGDIVITAAAPRVRDRFAIAEVRPAETTEEQKANAEFIVRACNAHDDLVAKLEALTKQAQDAIDQMIKGNWVDDHGHDVRLNVAMFNLPWAIREAKEILAKAKEPA